VTRVHDEGSSLQIPSTNIGPKLVSRKESNEAPSAMKINEELRDLIGVISYQLLILSIV